MKHIDTRTRMVKTYTVELSAEEARAIHALLNRLGPDDAIYGRGDEGPDTRLLEKETSWRARDHYNLSMHVCPRPHDGSLYPLRMRVGIDELVACDIGPTMKKLEKWVQPFVASVCRSTLTMLHRLEVYNSQEALCARLQEACTEARPQADALGVRLSVEGTRSTCVVTVTPTRDEPRGAGTGDAGPARTTPPLQLEFPPEQVDTAPERALQVWLIDWVPFHARLSKGNIKLRHQPRYP